MAFWKIHPPRAGIVMSGRHPLIKGFLRCGDNRGCGHVFGLLMRVTDPLALMLSASSLAQITLARF